MKRELRSVTLKASPVPPAAAPASRSAARRPSWRLGPLLLLYAAGFLLLSTDETHRRTVVAVAVAATLRADSTQDVGADLHRGAEKSSGSSATSSMGAAAHADKAEPSAALAKGLGARSPVSGWALRTSLRLSYRGETAVETRYM
ncbi:hypothetical protein ON010_g17564 [Phytophthora cinnamomi]|nr:hypothetical protein ON010_g17564 [Phytophthora cinnamomi]